jgi:sugar lactone lactonase YvrE
MMRPRTHKIACVADLRCELGESPVWDGLRDCVVFIDIPAGRIHAVSPRRGLLRSWTLRAPVTAVGLCSDGRHWVVALRDEVGIYDPENERLDVIARIPPPSSGIRLNDGKVGPDGAFWIGSMVEQPPRTPDAALYRVTANGIVARALSDIRVANGLAWSANGSTLFHADSEEQRINAYAFHVRTGSVGEGRLFARIDKGYPDGGASDMEGGYWSCAFLGGALNHFHASGALIQTIDVAIPAPTAPCFGGPDMRTLFFTSARESEDDTQPNAGGLFAIRVDVEGVPVSTFRV